MFNTVVIESVQLSLDDDFCKIKLFFLHDPQPDFVHCSAKVSFFVDTDA